MALAPLFRWQFPSGVDWAAGVSAAASLTVGVGVDGATGVSAAALLTDGVGAGDDCVTVTVAVGVPVENASVVVGVGAACTG